MLCLCGREVMEMVDDMLFSCAVSLAAGMLSGKGEDVEDDDINACVRFCYDVLGEVHEEIDADSNR